MPPKLGQIVETILYTSSVPKLAQWYSSHLSITPFTYSPSFAAFSLPNDTILILFDPNTTVSTKNLLGGAIPPHGAESTKGQHIAFGCGGKEELTEWEAHLKCKGIEIEGRAQWERGGESIYFRDGEGHLVEIMTRAFGKFIKDTRDVIFSDASNSVTISSPLPSSGEVPSALVLQNLYRYILLNIGVLLSCTHTGCLHHVVSRYDNLSIP